MLLCFLNITILKNEHCATMPVGATCLSSMTLTIPKARRESLGPIGQEILDANLCHCSISLQKT